MSRHSSWFVECLLGAEADLEELYSYPNLLEHDGRPAPNNGTLRDTILHFIGQTLRREGFEDEGVRAEIAIDREQRYTLRFSGPSFDEPDLRIFAERLPEMLKHDRDALGVVAEIKKRPEAPPPPKPWDPHHTVWRPFFGHGLPMVRQRCVQFFHYPPIRLLDPYRDYLNDPVPRMVEQLLLANIGWAALVEYGELSPDEREHAYRLALYERVVDACPVAANDDQGQYIPVEDFPDYQRHEMQLFTQDHSIFTDFTIPVVAYGTPARNQLKAVFGAVGQDPGGPPTPESNVTPPKGGLATIRPGKQTPFVTMGHPYSFYLAIQGSPANVGKGNLTTPANGPAWEASLRNLLAVGRWTLAMAGDPTQDPVAKLRDYKVYWDDASRRQQIQALIRHLGSYTTDPEDPLKYSFPESIPDALAYVKAHPDAPYTPRSGR